MIQKQLEELKSNFLIIIPEDGLKVKLEYCGKNKKPLNIKLGFDPTAPELHLGHAVVLKKLKQFQKYGHQIIIIIGDFTARIGDPTGRNKTRAPLNLEEVQENAKTYLDQLSLIIDVSKAKICFNSKWLNDMSFIEIIKLFSHLTVNQILQRDDFSNRFKENLPIHLHELVYPIIQGYDSLIINSDIEIGGTDQMFNCLVGRDIQNAYNKNKQIVACMPILRGTDGEKKMSKSLNNYIGLKEHHNDMFGKVMSIPDSLITEYAELACEFSKEKLEQIKKNISNPNINPINIKKELAFNIVEQYHGIEKAEEALLYFYNQVQSRDDSLIEYQPIRLNDLNLIFSEITILDLCKALEPDQSKSALRKLISNGGVKINSQKILDPSIIIKTIIQKSFNLKIGKRRYYKIIIK